MSHWIDTHCHLDAPEFAHDIDAVRADARVRGVALCVLPAVAADHFDGARALAHRLGDAYALGIHPLFVPQAGDDDLQRLDDALTRWRDDPCLVAVGAIGLDFFVPALCEPAMRARQEHFFTAQLKIARRHGLPVLLHTRRSVDAVLKGLRRIEVPGGIAHAFNGSEQQAGHFIERGFMLGFGGASTFDRAQQLRHLAAWVPADRLVLETDAPDMPPHWLYRTAQQRTQEGLPQGRNTPAELPRIAEAIAALRGLPLAALRDQAQANACQAMPSLAALLS
ncbi:MAG: putative metal-dependent hydrolase YjjV [Paracidovorax wautersii]|uniref:Putative metal-dependent hydrolase YjjV n=1 Tax=Paracidovorax wautersii TaxID=1177982 RepID=A0A7V8JRH8_9BURK|nr:MAG: putative metal-dependent hydrolase YjjV [Paracidovorax wautersii]